MRGEPKRTKKKSTLLANVMQLCWPLPSHTCSILLGSKLQSCEVDKIWGRSWTPFGNLFWLCQALPSTPGTREWFANIPMIALIIALFCIANMANLHTSHEICKFLIQVLKFISKDNFAFYLEVADESRFKDDQIFSTKKLFHTFSTKKLLEVAGSGESRWQGCDKCSLPPDCHDCHDDGHCTIIWRQHNNILNLMSKWAKWPPAFTSREYKHFNWNLLCAAVSLPAGVMSEWFNKDTSGDSSCHVIVLIHLYIDTDWLWG